MSSLVVNESLVMHNYVKSESLKQSELCLVSSGKITLDHMFQEREQLNHNIVGKSLV